MRRELGDEYVDAAAARSTTDRIPGQSRPLLLLVREGPRAHRGRQAASAPDCSPRRASAAAPTARCSKRIKETGDIFFAESPTATGFSTARTSTSPWSASTTARRQTQALDGRAVAVDQRQPHSRGRHRPLATPTDRERAASASWATPRAGLRHRLRRGAWQLLRRAEPARPAELRCRAAVAQRRSTSSSELERMWIVDFGWTLTETTAAQYEAPFEHRASRRQAGARREPP